MCSCGESGKKCGNPFDGFPHFVVPFRFACARWRSGIYPRLGAETRLSTPRRRISDFDLRPRPAGWRRTRPRPGMFFMTATTEPGRVPHLRIFATVIGPWLSRTSERDPGFRETTGKFFPPRGCIYDYFVIYCKKPKKTRTREAYLPCSTTSSLTFPSSASRRPGS